MGDNLIPTIPTVDLSKIMTSFAEMYRNILATEDTARLRLWLVMTDDDILQVYHDWATAQPHQQSLKARGQPPEVPLELLTKYRQSVEDIHDPENFAERHEWRQQLLAIEDKEEDCSTTEDWGEWKDSGGGWDDDSEEDEPGTARPLKKIKTEK